MSGSSRGVYAVRLAALVALASWILMSSVQAANSADGLWRDQPELAIPRSAQARQIIPLAYRSLKLDLDQLESLLAQLPLEAQVPVARSLGRIELPLPDGSFGGFQIVESPIMEPALAARYRQLRTYLGQGIDDPTATVRFDRTPTGFHAQIISWQGTTYIDPYQPGDIEHYIVYRKADAQEDGERPVCIVTGQELPKDAPNFQKRGVSAKIASGATLRTYRTAVAATGEYTAFHGGTVAGGLAAIFTTLNLCART